MSIVNIRIETPPDKPLDYDLGNIDKCVRDATRIGGRVDIHVEGVGQVVPRLAAIAERSAPARIPKTNGAKPKGARLSSASWSKRLKALQATDKRVVVEEIRGSNGYVSHTRIDVKRTLENMSLSLRDLLAKDWPAGSLERTLKWAYSVQQAVARGAAKRVEQELAAS